MLVSVEDVTSTSRGMFGVGTTASDGQAVSLEEVARHFSLEMEVANKESVSYEPSFRRGTAFFLEGTYVGG